MRVDWTEFKNVISARNLDILMTQNSYMYYLMASENAFTVACHLIKDDSEETVEFETDYLHLCNPYRQIFDNSGKPFARFAIANEGHVLNCMALTFTTSKSGSLKCTKDDNSTNVSGLTYEQFDSNDDAGTDGNSVKTDITIELPYDFEIVGGRLWQKATPSTDIYAYLTAIPDIPEEYGGSRSMCFGGVNLKFLNLNYGIDGRAPKTLVYDAVNHTNKLRLRFFHDAGVQHDLMFNLEMYR